MEYIGRGVNTAGLVCDIVGAIVLAYHLIITKKQAVVARDAETGSDLMHGMAPVRHLAHRFVLEFWLITLLAHWTPPVASKIAPRVSTVPGQFQSAAGGVDDRLRSLVIRTAY